MDILGPGLSWAVRAAPALYRKVSDWKRGAWHRLTRTRRLEELVEVHVISFEMSEFTNKASEALLHVLIVNFAAKPISAELRIDSWSVGKYEMPHAGVSSGPTPVEPKHSAVLLVKGNPATDDLRKFEQTVPYMVRLQQEMPHSFPAAFAGSLTLTAGRNIRTREFREVYPNARVRLIRNPPSARPPSP